ncbi:hypothetical protein HRR83_002719 [Exophiala dermatitidis]|uniref:NTF2-like domain-containing protein n=2 Tax=Exophiala dermatitidis TaxID=5970 RepID=H6C0D2_EXODN|nr:uncharacterized protein HMPREF1120_05273 [Exophiala dermatitidis NIH/UT8656]KAJ4516868.1 hypothetical protein HRR75_003528 [Exophiala dermatitidis]EHY57227.1 hypothetical protein HMPREF1120_05273 [Exophiala dermatitidis NIH/UT8656]KAJ4520846.1 hypothetical protein HRR74_003847 [Exophiala dermatitidis]KAJ4521989.1 hypothetical protein HRR73_003188 [Exophiala dermatitidis]KAJ4537495.1 hypothetical protein HRR76_005496 [Exophiala dermatitidis]
MQYLSIALPLAVLVSGTFANPLERRGGSECKPNACLAAVTGKAALGDDHLRGGHCSSFLATTVTPPAVTVTETVTGAGKDQGHWKRASVTVCPNEVPNYASACDLAAYTSACSCFGFTEVKTTTIAPTTTTKTVYVAPTGAACSTAVIVSGTTCPAGETSTVTVTVTASGSGWSGHSSSASATSSTPASSCVVDDAKATEIVNNFAQLLEFTSYAGNAAQGIPAGSGYKQDVSDATLSDKFTDISDSINFMAGFPLGSVTFNSKAAFDYGQGVLQPEVSVTTLNVFHDCNSITWRYRLLPNPQALPVTGINYMIIDPADGKILKNYAEFDNGAWLQSFGRQCAVSNVTVYPGAPATKRSIDGQFKVKALHQ